MSSLQCLLLLLGLFLQNVVRLSTLGVAMVSMSGGTFLIPIGWLGSAFHRRREFPITPVFVFGGSFAQVLFDHLFSFQLGGYYEVWFQPSGLSSVWIRSPRAYGDPIYGVSIASLYGSGGRLLLLRPQHLSKNGFSIAFLSCRGLQLCLGVSMCRGIGLWCVWALWLVRSTGTIM